MKVKDWKSLIVITIAILIGGKCLADGDFQYWGAAGVSFDITKHWQVVFEEEFRFEDDAGRLYYQHSDLALVYKGLAEWIDLGFNYRQVFKRKSQWKQENRPHLNVTLKRKLLDFKLSNRSRLEYRDREDKKDLWRYRNKVTVEFPIELTRFKLRPYLADEMFFDFYGEGYNKNRLYTGISLDLTPNLKGGIFYLWQSTKSAGGWEDIHIIGSRLRFHF